VHCCRKQSAACAYGQVAKEIVTQVVFDIKTRAVQPQGRSSTHTHTHTHTHKHQQMLINRFASTFPGRCGIQVTDNTPKKKKKKEEKKEKEKQLHRFGVNQGFNGTNLMTCSAESRLS